MRRQSGLLLAFAILGCGPPLREVRLEPPAQIVGSRTVQVESVAITDDVLQAGFHPGDSRVAVRVRLSNQSRQPQSYRLLEATLELADPSGAPRFAGAGQVYAGTFRLPPAPSYTIDPGADLRLTLEFDRFPWYESGRPLRATLRLPTDGAPLEVVLADVADPQAPRWKLRRSYPFWRTGWRYIGGRVDGNALDIIDGGLHWSTGRRWLGFGVGWGFLFNNALLAGPPAGTLHGSIEGGWLPYQRCCGVYGAAEYLLAFFNPPFADSHLRGGGPHGYPDLSAGVVFKAGTVRRGGGPFPVETPPTGLGGSAFRLGYVRWFNTGDRFGTSGFLLGWEVTQ